MFEIIAHRGASLDAPENTLAAVRLAWEQQADAVEVDVRLTRDGQIVAIHDEDLRRTGGVPSRIADCTLAELRQSEVGAWKNLIWAGEPIPLLAELLATLPVGKRFFVEVKCGLEIVDELVRVVRASPNPAAVVPIGFPLDVLAALKQQLPECQVYGVFDFKRERAGANTPWRPTTEELLEAAHEYRLDGVDLNGSGPIDASMVAALTAAGLDVCIWTVDDPVRARYLLRLGVAGITTNRPGWLRKHLAVVE